MRAWSSSAATTISPRWGSPWSTGPGRYRSARWAFDSEPSGTPRHPGAAADLGRHGVAARDGEHPLEGGEVGRVGLLVGRRPQPRPQRPPGQRVGRGRDGAGVGGVADGLTGQGVEERGVGAGEVGEAAEQGHDVALGDVVEQRQHLVTDAVAPEAGVEVRGVDDGLESEVGTEPVGLGPAQPDDRVPRAGRQGGEAVDPGAPQEGEQHGLGAVVGGVAGGVVGWEHGAAGGASAGLEVGAVGRPRPARLGTRHRSAPPPLPPSPPPPTSRDAARGRRGRR